MGNKLLSRVVVWNEYEFYSCVLCNDASCINLSSFNASLVFLRLSVVDVSSNGLHGWSDSDLQK